MSDVSAGREGEKVRVGLIFDRNVRGVTAVVSTLLAVFVVVGADDVVISSDVIEEGREGLLVGEGT